MPHYITFASALMAYAHSLEVTVDISSASIAQERACSEMHPEVKDKILKLKKYAAIVLPDIPDWVVGEDEGSSNNPRCCTTLQ